ncbi:CopG family transcriptional regulator [Halosegnis marinus]|uniref:CopG family transcriptional regulator n=1 Tax=Halosegnis marinus TaxID=3034023 RepID=A0ABD5ZQG7_9EURY|nr:CopG family transcriptional regulator [Halosegnis sp. DT85]
MRRFTFAPSPATAREIEALAREFDLSESEVVAQLVELGLEEVEGTERRVTE